MNLAIFGSTGPTGRQLVQQALEQGHTVYVHCSAGLGRSPSVVIAYLHWIKGVDLEEAIAQVPPARAA